LSNTKKHRVKHRDFDVQYDQSGEAVDGFSEVDGLGVEIDFFDFCVGTHYEMLAPERNREHSIGDQVVTLNVGFMERLRQFCTQRSGVEDFVYDTTAVDFFDVR